MPYIIATNTCFWLACKTNDIEWYDEIYKLKNRDYSKLLAIIVPDFETLKKYTNITDEQIEFLKNYNKAFSVILDTKNKSDFISENIKNKDLYWKISFRIATKENYEFVKENKAMFLTSANLSWLWETYSLEEIKEQFWDNFSKLKLIWNKKKLDIVPASDIIEFWENNEIIFLRKS